MKTNIWDFFSNHKNIRICAGCEGVIVQQSKLLAQLHLVHLLQTVINIKLMVTSKQLYSQR